MYLATQASTVSELFAVKKGSLESAIIVEPKINGVTLPMDLDTGPDIRVSYFRKGVEGNFARVGTGQVCYPA